MTSNYVDDGINCDKAEVEQFAERTMQAFECGDGKYGDSSFFGTHIYIVGENEFLLNQKHYCAEFWKVPITSTKKDFQRLRTILAWITDSRPELAWLVNKTAQVTAKSFQEKHIRL